MRDKKSGQNTGNAPGKSPDWQAESALFPPLAPLPELESLPEILRQVWPLSAKHRRSLPRDIGELSSILTCQRSRLVFPYWQRPNLVSAYLYYFLPWNLIRLVRLLRGLPIPAPQDGQWLLDAGSGPLTVPLALWLARPEWRQTRINCLALDSGRLPLQLGAKLFNSLAAPGKSDPWSLATAVAPLEALPRHLPPAATPWLLTAANALNEMREQTGRHGATPDGEDRDRLGDLLQAWGPLLRQAPALFVEPGTRLGGDTIERLRDVALHMELTPLAPCTHARACPLQGDGKRWCHFVFSAQDAPDWLKNLAREARLFKTSLSLAPLYLSGAGAAGARGETTALPIRVISQPFAVGAQKARYGCAPCGLCLLPGAAGLVSGSLCRGEPTGERDAHSGARIMAPVPVRSKGRQAARKSGPRPGGVNANLPAPRRSLRGENKEDSP